jgi:hypothetical protein
MKKIILALFMISSLKTVAQTASDSIPKTSSSSLDIGVDIQSRYIWRGLQLGGNSPSAQPYMEFSTGSFSIGAWGAYNLGGLSTGNEADLYISYSISETFSITITDYFFPSDGNSQEYFPYNKGHVFEGMISFAGTDNFPIGLSVATNFGGAIKYDDNGKEKSAYSTYVEISYSKTIGEVEYSLFAGAVFADDNSYYLTDDSGLINLGISVAKEIKLSDSFSLPINAALILNPDAENIYLTFGFSL